MAGSFSMCRSAALCVACFHRGKSLPNGPCACSTSNLDTQVLQTIATRIYFGLFVAESKFRAVKECRLRTVTNSNRCIRRLGCAAGDCAVHRFDHAERSRRHHGTDHEGAGVAAYSSALHNADLSLVRTASTERDRWMHIAPPMHCSRRLCGLAARGREAKHPAGGAQDQDVCT